MSITPVEIIPHIRPELPKHMPYRDIFAWQESAEQADVFYETPAEEDETDFNIHDHGTW